MKPINQTNERQYKAPTRPRVPASSAKPAGICAGFTALPEPLNENSTSDAYDWVVSDDCRWPFSFRNVCQFLELSPESVRQELFRDISLGAIHYWTRSFGRVVRHFQISLCHFFTREHAAGPLVSGTLAPTVS